MTLIVILCVIGGILLVILIILCVCWYTRRKKEVVNNNYAGAYDVVRYTAAVRFLRFTHMQLVSQTCAITQG